MSSTTTRLREALLRVRRAVLRRRRPLAALCAAAAVAAGLHATTAPPPPTRLVVTAAHDLPAGAVLSRSDLASVSLEPDAVPAGAVSDPVGRTLAAPVRQGEPVTDVRLVGEALAEAHPDLTALPIRFPDAGLAALLAVGDRIDLVATDPQAGTTEEVATDALVLATPRPAADTSVPGVVVVLGVAPTAVEPVSQAAVRSFLAYSWTR